MITVADSLTTNSYRFIVNIQWIAALVLIPLLAACGGNDSDVVEKGQPASAADNEGAESESSDAPEEQGQLVESGFGQDGEYAGAMAIVENTSDHGGQTVTVSVNFLDENGEIITTEEQVESFAYAGQTLAMQVWGSMGSPKAKVASIEPTLLIEDNDFFDESDVQLDPVDSSGMRNQYGSWTPKIQLTNPTDEPLKDLRVGVVCRNAAGKIIGGGTDYPELLPPNGDIVLDPHITVSGEPSVCTAYPSPAGF